jgi:nicotinamide riboside kinase
MLKGDYSSDDVLKILEEQLKRQNEASAKNPALLFCDTEPINFKVWMEHVFGESPVWIDEYIAENPHNLYLLTSPDLPWESDPLRENEGKGEFFFDWYKMILDAFGLNYVVIQGQGSQRTDAAIDAVEKASGIRAVKRPTS